MENSEFTEEFFAEAREQLFVAEEDVLLLEQFGEHSDTETINRLFRALHSIKGGAACVNFQRIKELAHSMENVVGLFRDRLLAPTHAISQLLLDGLDKLKTSIESGDEQCLSDTEPVIAALTDIVDGSKSQSSASPQEPAPDTGHFFDLSLFDLSDVIEQSLNLYEFNLDIVAECAASHSTPAEFYKKICSVGTIIADCNTPTENPTTTMPCFFLLATMIDDPEILFPGLEINPVSFYRYQTEEIQAAGKCDRETVMPAAIPEIEVPPPEHKVPAKKPSSSKTGTVSKLTPGDNEHPVASVPLPVDEQTVRIPVELLDKLMNLVGELVVVRNRNAQLMLSGNIQELSVVNQRLNTVTTEIQMAVMKTRMRPIGSVFSRFARVIRDLSRNLGKEIELNIAGGDVELDKSIIDTIAEPLTHLVRNSADHGLETAEERLQAGKPAIGHIRLSARHQAGMVNIRVVDDGRGIDPQTMRAAAVDKGIYPHNKAMALTDREAFELILLPGFSTSSKVTDLSGRGVGMDVVKTSLQKFGGVIEIQSVPGAGTTISINLPLTLAIIPALILTAETQCFAIPQVNINEVVWLHGDEVYQLIREIDDKEVYWLRGKMLPLLRLSKVLEIRPTYLDPKTNEHKPDRRKQAPDRRQKQNNKTHEKRTGPRDRRISIINSLFIIVLQVGSDQFGLCVESIVDTEEIVVKPLHENLKKCRVYAGITVLGNGSTSLIIDVPELAQIGGVRCDNADLVTAKSRSDDNDCQKMLVFSVGGNERFALPLSLLLRVDEVSSSELQISGGREYIRFRNSVIPLVRLETVIKNISPASYSKYLFTIIPRIGKPIGIAAAEIINIVDLENSMEPAPVDQTIIIGTQLVDGHLTGILDLCALVDMAEPGWFSSVDRNILEQRRVVLVEDSSFFRALLGSYLRGIGIMVTAVTNGREALEILNHTPVDVIISDLEMPVMDGFELARHIKTHPSHNVLPLMAISAMDETVARRRALDAGFDEFCSKNNLPQIVSLLNTILTKDNR